MVVRLPYNRHNLYMTDDSTNLARLEQEPLGHPHLYLVPPIADVEPEPQMLPTREQLDIVIDEQGIGAYRSIVEEFDIPNPEQYQMVAEIDSIVREIAQQRSLGGDTTLLKERLNTLRHELYVGNLASIADEATAIFKSGHRSPLKKILHTSNLWAEQWFKKTYATPKSLQRAPVYPRDIVASDEVGHRLKQCFKTGIRVGRDISAVTRKPKTNSAKKQTSPKPGSSKEVIKATDQGQLYLANLLGKYRRPPRDVAEVPTEEKAKTARLIGEYALPFPAVKPHFAQTNTGQQYAVRLLGEYDSPPVSVASTENESAQPVARGIGQLALKFPRPRTPNKRERTALLQQQEIQRTDYGDLSRFDVHTGRPNPNAIAGSAEDMAVLEWISRTYRDHRLNTVRTRYVRDFSGFATRSQVIEKLQSAVYDPAMTDLDFLMQQLRTYPLLDGRQHELTVATTIKEGIAAQQAIDDLSFTSPEELRILQHKVIVGAGAYDTFYQSNLRLVYSIAKLYPGNAVESILDRFQVGSVGLQRAIQKFDPSKGFKFSTYATWWIKQSIQRSRGEVAFDVRLPVHVSDEFKKLNAFRLAWHDQHGKWPANQDFCENGFQEETVLQWQTFGKKTAISLDTPVGESDRELYDLLADNGLRPEEAAEENLHRQQLIDMITAAPLTDREKLIISGRWKVPVPGVDYSLAAAQERDGIVLGGTYGHMLHHAITWDSALRLEELGDILGVSRERIRQLESLAIGKIYIQAALSSIAQTLEFDAERIELADAYFSVERRKSSKNHLTMIPMEVDVNRLLKRLHYGDSSINDYIDEWINDHYGGDRPDLARDYLACRFGLVDERIYSYNQSKGLKIDPHLAVYAEAYVLGRIAGLFTNDLRMLDIANTSRARFPSSQPQSQPS